MNRVSSIVIPTLFATILLLTGSCTDNRKQARPAGHDSLYTVAHIQDISITRPHEALALLDTAEMEMRMKPFDISRLRCLVYHNGLSDYKRALTHGLRAYRRPEARKNPETFLKLVELIADECHNSGDYAGSMRYCSEGLVLAQQVGDKPREANFHVTFGLNLFEMRRQDEAFKHFRLAVGMLEEEAEGSSSYREWDSYVYALGITINLYCEGGQYDEAVALLPACEEAIRRLGQRADIPDGLADMRRACYYAACAHLYGQKGNMEEAAKSYALLDKTRWASTPDGEFIRVPYLLASRRYDEALGCLLREKQMWKENADTVSYDYLKYQLRRELAVYEGVGNLNAACRVQDTMLVLMDTLRQRERQEDALELAEVYKTNEQAARLKEQETGLRIRLLIIVFTALLLAGAVGFIVRILRDKRIILKKNHVMSGTIDELMTYKQELFKRQEENIHLRDQLKQLREAAAVPDDDAAPESADVASAESSSETAKPSAATFELTEQDRALYYRIDHEIVGRKLYLRPDFNKSELLKEIHVPANKFASLFKEFAGCSFSQYLQELRLDYAIGLMREHPLWSMEAVAREAQMSNGAFYSQFQRKYGMKPSDYRKKEILSEPVPGEAQQES